MSTQTIERQIQTLAMQMHDVVTDDSLSTPEKQAKYEAMDSDLKALQAKYVDAKWLDERRMQLHDIIGDGDAAPEDEHVEPANASKSLGQQFVDSETVQQVLNLRKSIGGSTRVETGPISLSSPRFFNVLTESGLGSANVVEPDRQPGILPILFQRLTIADLMPNTTTTSNTVRYAKESTATNAASTVAESGTKPTSALNFTVVDEPIRKIATVLKAADEILEDIPQLTSYVNGRLVLFVRLEEEAQLLTGNTSTGANDIVGLLNRSGLTAAQAKGGDSIAVAVHKDVTKIRVASFLDPDAVVFHPNDWEAARLEADLNGQFYGGGPFTGAYGVNGIAGDSYWGLRVVSTTAMTENTALIGAFAMAAEVVRRSGITVEMTNSNEDDFIKNLVTFRAEERLGLKVFRPAAFSTVTGI